MIAILVAVLVTVPPNSSGPARAAAQRRALTPGSQESQPQAPSADPSAQLSDDDVRGQVQALLGSIDTHVSDAHWLGLGPRAAVLLEQTARDPQQLPTRRAKALDALAAFGAKAPAAPFHELAQEEKEPLVVRLSAVRGLGRVAKGKKLLGALQPLLETAQESRVRATAAEVLVRQSGPAHCALIKAQLDRESEEVRGQFHRSARLCGAPAGVEP